MSDHPTVVLDGDMGIADAALLRQRLLAALAANPGGLALDLAAVDTCDSAGVQLLLALRHSLTARGATLQICAAAAPVRQALATYGLTDLLNAAADAGEPA